MNENAKKWVEALRSGNYSQTRDALQDSQGFCCLGVACDVYEKATGNKLNRSEHTGFFTCESVETLGDEYFLVVRDWLGLETGGGDYFDDGEKTNLYKKNDSGYYSFEDIADIIESEPEGLFYDR